MRPISNTEAEKSLIYPLMRETSAKAAIVSRIKKQKQQRTRFRKKERTEWLG